MNLPQFANPPCLIKATYSINTPMFAGGANPNEAELTPTSFKGVMRFWWRTLNWSKIRLSKPGDSEALKALHKQEARLFGVATNNDDKNRTWQGQGACLINSISTVSASSGNSPNLLNTFNIKKDKKYNRRKAQEEDVYPIDSGIAYLMGQGLYDYKKGVLRGIVQPLQDFTIEFTVEQAYHQAVIDVLKIIGLLGGLGSRSRHGFGSVTLQSLAQKTAQSSEYTDLPLDMNNPVMAIRDLLERYNCRNNTNLPPLSAFYKDTRIDVMKSSNLDALTLLNEVGEEEQMYRSYGRKDDRDNVYKVNGKKVKQNFRGDHDLIINLADREYRGQITHPKRVVFGLPHNYRYSNGLDVKVDSTTGRRASPLFFHVHKMGSQYQLISCLLKSQFLPDDAQITFSKNRRNADVNTDWQVITDFMDRDKFANKETL